MMGLWMERPHLKLNLIYSLFLKFKPSVLGLGSMLLQRERDCKCFLKSVQHITNKKKKKQNKKEKGRIFNDPRKEFFLEVCRRFARLARYKITNCFCKEPSG